MDINEIIAQYSTNAVKTAGVAEVATTVESAVKQASENGVHEAENMMKIASVMGDVIGNRIADIVESRLATSFGYDPEVMKTASIQDVMYDALYKVAEHVNGTQGNAAVAAQNAEEVQLSEAVAHHANLAATSASDAVQSLQQGDNHTATQQMNTSVGAIQVAQQLAARIPNNAAVANHVNEAAAIVEDAHAAVSAQLG